ncbi:MAG: hypothetical protein KGD64_14035 [Candidatus Heimdallarchaeota archaeon]|nr:hypothetical protein [Candidatus Heimdallarchaeota archaeon]
MLTITESVLVRELALKWSKVGLQVVKELVVPIIDNIYYDNYLEGRDSIRIDLAAYDPHNDKIIFVEAENGLYLPHPQIYLPFCNELYVLCPEDLSSFRNEQMEWSRDEGIGIIEMTEDGEITTSLSASSRKIYPSVEAYVKARLFKKIEKERKKK